MRRHVIALALSIVLLLVSLSTLSCVPKTNSQSAEPTDGLAYKSDVTGLSGRLDSQSQRIDAIAGKSGMSREEVQAMIDSALANYAKKSDIQALKDDQTWIKGTTHTTPAGTVAGEYGELVDTNGDLELWLEKVGGDADSELFTTYKNESSRANFDFVVVNKDSGGSHDFRITITLMPQENVTTGASTASADNGLTFVVSARAASSSDDLSLKSNDRRVAKSDNESFRVVVNIPQSDIPVESNVVDWNLGFDILDKGT